MASGTQGPERRFRRSLARSTLFILLILSIGPLLLMGSAAYMRTRELLRQEVFTQLSTAANVQSERLLGEVQTGRQMLSQALVNPLVVQKMAAALDTAKDGSGDARIAQQEFISSLQGANQLGSYFSQFLVVLPTGQVQLSSVPEWENLNLANSSLYRPADGPLSRALLAPSPLYNQDFVIASQIPIRDKNNQLQATVIGIAEPALIQNWLKESTFFADRSFMVTPDGSYIGLDPWTGKDPQLTRLEATSDQRLMQEYVALQPNRQGVREMTSFGELPVIAAYDWLPDLQVGWVAEIAQDKVYGELNSLVLFSSLLLIATVVLLAIIVWQVTRFLVRPLTDLSATVSSFSAGEWDQRSPILRSDEVGFLAYSFNNLADEMSDLYRSLETKVSERTNQLQVAGEIAHIGVSSSSLDELLQRTVNMLTNRFGFASAAIYLLDESGEYAILRQVAAPTEIQKNSRGLRVKVQPLSLVGWVALTNTHKVDLIGQGAFGALERVDLVPGTRVEAGVPITISERLLGVLVAQASKVTQLNDDTVKELQLLANQIAPAVQNFYLLEATQINLQETNLLYQFSHQIAQANSEEKIIDLAKKALQNTSYPASLLLSLGDRFRIIRTAQTAQDAPGGDELEVTPANLLERLRSTGPYILTNPGRTADMPVPVLDLVRELQSNSVAFLPVVRSSELVAVLLLGSGVEETRANIRFTQYNLQPYTNLAELITTSLEKVNALKSTQYRLRELEVLNEMSQAISRQTEPETVYSTIQRYVSEVLGEVDFLIAELDKETNLIEVPYACQDGSRIQLVPLKPGESLTSIVLHSRQALRIGDAQGWQNLEAEGILPAGASAKSWMGVPIQVGGEVLGAIVVLDNENELRFSSDDERFLTTLANQAGIALRNVNLLESAREKAAHESLLLEITSKIRRASSIPEILETTTRELGSALRLKRAQIAIQPDKVIDPPAQPGSNGNGNGNRAGSSKRQPTES